MILKVDEIIESQRATQTAQPPILRAETKHELARIVRLGKASLVIAIVSLAAFVAILVVAFLLARSPHLDERFPNSAKALFFGICGFGFMGGPFLSLPLGLAARKTGAGRIGLILSVGTCLLTVGLMVAGFLLSPGRP